MKRHPTEKDLRLLINVRDRLHIALLDMLPRPLRRTEHDRFLNEPNSAKVPIAPIDCNHGVPWTDCTTCSKPRVR